jgi:Tfp pilus assembly protein PilF
MNARFHHGRASRPLVWLALALTCVTTACAASEEQVRKSDGYYQEGLANLPTDRQRAFVSFQKAVQLNPNNRDAHYGLGHIYAQQGKYQEAEEEFRRVLRIDPEHSESHTYIGQIMTKQGRWDEAIAEYKQALSNPLYATPDLARFHLGRALAHQGDMKAAVAAYEDASQVNPPNISPAMLNLELGRAYLGLGFEQRAKETLTKVAGMDKGGEYGVAAEQLLRSMKQY